MSNRDDDFTFDDSDDFFKDDSDPFSDFDDESGVTSGLGDSIAADLPELSDEPDEPRTNTTFVILAILLVLLFVIGLGVILFLATQNRGPTPIELTSTAIAQTNAVVLAQLAETQTQDVSNIQLTQTALAASPTPSPTFTPSDTPIPTSTEAPPTLTPTSLEPTFDLTLAAALTQNAQLAGTATAIAAATLNVTPPTPIPPTDTPFDINASIRQRFATEVAFATLAGVGQQSQLATQQALATQGAISAQQAAAEILGTVEADRSVAQGAIQSINDQLQAIAQQRIDLASALTQSAAEGQQTQAALEAPFAQGTQVAGATQAAAATLVADLAQQFNDPSLAQPGGIATVIVNATQAAAATQAFFDEQATQGVNIVTPAVEATQVSTATRAALEVQAGVATEVAQATQSALEGPRVFATQAGLATEVALATRNALIELALFESPTPGPTLEVQPPTLPPTLDALASINATATAIAAQFLTATAQVTTPEAVTLTPGPSPTGFVAQAAPSATPSMPQTGIFEDVVGGVGGSLGGLLLIVVGLVGALFGARALRSANQRALESTPEEPEQTDKPDEPNEPPPQ